MSGEKFQGISITTSFILTVIFLPLRTSTTTKAAGSTKSTSYTALNTPSKRTDNYALFTRQINTKVVLVEIILELLDLRSEIEGTRSY